MMDDAATPARAWPDQRLKILIPCWLLMVVSTVFVVWRFIYGALQLRRFLLCDYLLAVAATLNIAATCNSQVIVDAGLGRHITDPTVEPTIAMYSYYLWITQLLNIVAVAFLKWSICAYLLALNFSEIYRVIVWLSILMVTAFNFLAPVLTLFGCSPLEANWNYLYEPRKCWAKGTLQLSYTQGISNIITDVVYMAAPLIYLSRVQLSKRTQWGIRIVFLLSIPATICSISKTVELKAITKTHDPTWTATDLQIWSSAEASIGVLIASLPPLRKALDTLLGRFLPGTRTKTYGVHSIRISTFRSNRSYHSRLPGESALDHSSDGEDRKGRGIMKTTRVDIEERPSSRALNRSRNDDWPL